MGVPAPFPACTRGPGLGRPDCSSPPSKSRGRSTKGQFYNDRQEVLGRPAVTRAWLLGLDWQGRLAPWLDSGRVGHILGSSGEGELRKQLLHQNFLDLKGWRPRVGEEPGKTWVRHRSLLPSLRPLPPCDAGDDVHLGADPVRDRSPCWPDPGFTRCLLGALPRGSSRPAATHASAASPGAHPRDRGSDDTLRCRPCTLGPAREFLPGRLGCFSSPGGGSGQSRDPRRDPLNDALETPSHQCPPRCLPSLGGPRLARTPAGATGPGHHHQAMLPGEGGAGVALA